MLKKNNLLGVDITNEDEENILEYLLLSLKKSNEKYYIVTPNPEIVVYAVDHPDYRKVLNEARIALPDGIGVFLGSVLMGHVFKQRITGTDFMLEVCRRAAKKPITIGFLGGGDGVAKRTAECLKTMNPQLNVIFIAEEWGEEGFNVRKISNLKSQNSKLNLKSQNLKNKNRTSIQHIDVLFVAFGAPKQEEWIYKNLEHLPVKVAMGVGGAFDYISGEVDRAPFMIRAMGFEWLYRLKKQPWRWRRQLSLVRFVWLLIKSRLGIIKL